MRLQAGKSGASPWQGVDTPQRTAAHFAGEAEEEKEDKNKKKSQALKRWSRSIDARQPRQ
jgi:hypothetical protein